MAASPGRGSRKKGKNAELEVVHIARAHGFPDAARDPKPPQAYGDLRGIPGVYLEVRRRETLALPAWMAEAEERAARVGLIPAVCYRRNDEPWRVALPLTDFLDLLSVREVVNGAD